jgi:hypothetical protein
MTREELDGERVWVIDDFLSREECAALIRRSEALAYETGTVADVLVTDFRNNDRVMIDDTALAADLFGRARPFLPEVFDGQILAGFNERFRFYRYGPGQTFKPHRDGAYQRLKPWQESLLTFMVYLNDQVVGGETRFFAGMEHAFRQQPMLVVTPKEGMALVFVHRIIHEGATVQSGRKYVLRTDVMYADPPAPLQSGIAAGSVK